MFIVWRSAHGKHDAWDSIVYPGMKNAVTNALLCCQDDVEHRKVGAAEMLTQVAVV